MPHSVNARRRSQRSSDWQNRSISTSRLPGSPECRAACRARVTLCLGVGDTRPVPSAEAAQSRLRESHPEVFEALDLPKERQDALHGNVPACIEAVRLFPPAACATHAYLQLQCPWALGTDRPR